MKQFSCPIILALAVLCVSPIQAFAGAFTISPFTESNLTGSSAGSSSFATSSVEAGANRGQQDSQLKRSMIKYGFDLASTQPSRADATLVSLRGGLTSVSRKAAAAGVELTVVW